MGALLLAVAAARLGAQISPGPLSRPHAALDGPLQCTKCHGGHREPMAQMCNACHREIAWLQAHDRGLHARDARGDCSSCHPEHAGRTFSLIRWREGSAARFAHERTGWPLEGKHAQLECVDCHKPAFRKGPAAALAPRPGGATWVGLERRCATVNVEGVKPSTLWQASQSTVRPASVARPACGSVWQSAHRANAGCIPDFGKPAWQDAHATARCFPRSG